MPRSLRVSQFEFEDLDHARQFAQEQGFQIEEFSMLEVINQLSCLSALEIDLDRAKTLLAATPIFALTLNSKPQSNLKQTQATHLPQIN
jgi:hypothetical protein